MSKNNDKKQPTAIEEEGEEEEIIYIGSDVWINEGEDEEDSIFNPISQRVYSQYERDRNIAYLKEEKL